MSCKDNYIWSGSSYETTQSGDCYILHLGGGRTLCDIINSNSTATPDHIELYSGEDPEVPAAIRCSDRDLVIRCNEASSILSASVCYYDSLSRVWRGPYSPETSFTDTTKTWFVFRKYLDIVIPFKSEVRLQMSGAVAPIEPPKQSVAGASVIQIIQPPEEFDLSLVVDVYNDPSMQDLNVRIDTANPQEDFPVAVYNGSAFKAYPTTGVTKATAGQYVVVSLKNLEYKDIVYIKWKWLDARTGAVAGSGATIFPAYTAANPDNIGFVWETNM